MRPCPWTLTRAAPSYFGPAAQMCRGPHVPGRDAGAPSVNRGAAITLGLRTAATVHEGASHVVRCRARTLQERTGDWRREVERVTDVFANGCRLEYHVHLNGTPGRPGGGRGYDRRARERAARPAAERRMEVRLLWRPVQEAQHLRRGA